MSIYLTRTKHQHESTINYKGSNPFDPELYEGINAGTWHMGGQNSKFYEPQRSNNFEFIVPELGLGDIIMPGAITGTGDEDMNLRNFINLNAASSAEEVLRLAVASVSLPHYSLGVLTIRRGNSSIKYAGTPEFGSGSLSINDYIGADAKIILCAWQNQSYNVRTEKVGLASDYKHDCFLHEYTPDYQLVRSWKLYGCWVSSVDEGTWDYDSNNTKKVNATIQFDRAVLDTSEYAH